MVMVSEVKHLELKFFTSQSPEIAKRMIVESYEELAWECEEGIFTVNRLMEHMVYQYIDELYDQHMMGAMHDDLFPEMEECARLAAAEDDDDTDVHLQALDMLTYGGIFASPKYAMRADRDQDCYHDLQLVLDEMQLTYAIPVKETTSRTNEFKDENDNHITVRNMVLQEVW